MTYETRYKNVLLVGTSHIAEKSIETITQVFNDYRPDIVCVELDHARLHGLLTNAKPDYSLSGIKKFGFQGYLFAVIGGLLQKKLGNIAGIKPGSDMLVAVNLSKINNKELQLVDQNIEITLRRFSKTFTFKEKIRLLADIFKAPFTKKVSFDLRKVPEQKIILALMNQLKERYPSIYRVLIEERNVVMAKNIYNIMSRNEGKKIFVVIGAGHEEGLMKLIKQENFKRDRIK